MSHDASKVLLGATRSSFKTVTNHVGAIQAGLGVRLKSDDTLSVTKADGEFIGISLGNSLDGVSARKSVCRQGELVPMLLKADETLDIGDQVGVDDATGEAAEIDTGVTGINAVVRATGITGVKEDGTEAACILVDLGQ